MRRVGILLLAVILAAAGMPVRPARAEAPEMQISVSGGEVLPGLAVVIAFTVPGDGTCDILLTDEDGEAVCKWDKGFQMYEPPEEGEEEDDEDNPFVDAGEGRSLVFVIGVVSADYEDNVRQDRVGSITAVATINSSGVFVNPDTEEL